MILKIILKLFIIQKFRLIFSLIISNLLNNFLILLQIKRRRKTEPPDRKDKTK